MVTYGNNVKIPAPAAFQKNQFENDTTGFLFCPCQTIVFIHCSKTFQ
jgi:hypothetical protein